MRKKKITEKKEKAFVSVVSGIALEEGPLERGSTVIGDSLEGFSIISRGLARERERERETDRQTDRLIRRNIVVIPFLASSQHCLLSIH